MNSRSRKPLGLVLVLLLLAGVLGLWGYRNYERGTSTLAPVGPRGTIVLMSSGAMEVNLVEAFVSPPPLADGSSAARLKLWIWIDHKTDAEAQWGVAMLPPTRLAQNTAVTIGGSPWDCDTTGPPSELSSPRSNIGVIATTEYLGSRRVDLVRGFKPTSEAITLDGYGVCLELPLAQPVVTAAEAQYLISPPELGYNASSDGLFTMASAGYQFEELFPKRYRVAVIGNAAEDVLSSPRSLAQPIDGANWVWESRARTLSVQASVTRPSAQAAQQKYSFTAGILISLTVALVLWVLEILFGPDRQAVFSTQSATEIPSQKTEVLKVNSTGMTRSIAVASIIGAVVIYRLRRQSERS